MYRRTGFTLVELLVGAAIMAMLSAILFPVFSQARGSARTATPITEFKQKGQAVLMYAQDYDEAFPKSQTTVITAGFKASPKPKPRFVETGCINGTNPTAWQSLNGGCQDMVASLVWSRTSDETTGQYNRVYSREPTSTAIAGAKEYCRDLAEGDCPDQPDGLCRGWRLPTKDEVATAASHQIGSYVPMRFPNTWSRWAGPEFTKSRDLYAYLTKIGTGTATAVIAKDKHGNNRNYADAICVRTP